MPSRVIKQAITNESLFNVLSQWFQNGAGDKNQSIKILTAFITGGGVKAITPFIDNFLAKGNEVEIVFGIDRGGTDREAVKQLFFLQNAHTHQLTASYFQAPARNSIFHPKLYIYEQGNKVSFVIGSANLTYSGLSSNLESLILFEDLSINSSLVSQVLTIWESFANPASPPLPKISLNQLTEKNVKSLVQKLPQGSNQEQRRNAKTKYLWQPLSNIPIPNIGKPANSRGGINIKKHSSFLVMDLLEETRKTQVQLRLPIVEGFFGVPKNQPAIFRVRIIANGKFTNPIERPLVISKHMRRLEIPQIKNLDRPLAVIFIKLSGKFDFAYSVIKRNSPQYKIVEKFLATYGQQKNFERRFYIGYQNDPHWAAIKKLLQFQ